MSELIPPVRSTALTKRQARALEKSDYIRYLQEADLSDARRYFELARLTTSQHDKTELMAGAAVGITVALLFGGGSWLTTMLTGAGAFVATLVVIFVIHWARSPSAFYRAAMAELNSARAALIEREPRLVGRIICEDIKLVPRGDPPTPLYDCFAIFQVLLTNESAATMVSVFYFDLLWRDQDYPSIPQSVDDYYVKHITAHADEVQIQFERQPLNAFPKNEEITKTNYKMGWLRFWVGTIPAEMVDGRSLHEEVSVSLTAFDSKGKPHTIYRGSVRNLSVCPEIQRPKRNMAMRIRDGRPTFETIESFED